MNTLIRFVLLILIVIGVATYIEVMGMNDDDFDVLSRSVDQRLDESDALVSEEISRLSSAIGSLERSIVNLERRLGVDQGVGALEPDQSVGADPAAADQALIEEAAANPRAVNYRNMASRQGAVAMAGIAANDRFGSVLDSLGLDNETRRLAMEALTGIMADRTRDGMEVVMDQSIEEYLRTRKTQEQLDQETRAALSEVLTRAQIDQVIAQQDVNREARARMELRGADSQLDELGLTGGAKSTVMRTLVNNFKEAQTVDWPSIGGGSPQPMQIAYTGNEAKINGIFLARESLQEQLSENDMIAVDTVLSSLVEEANQQVEAARMVVNRNAGITTDQ